MKQGRTIKIILLALSLLVIASLAAVACGSSETTTTTSTTSPTSSTTTSATSTTASSTATTTTTTTSSPTSAVKTGGTLRVGLNQDYPTIGNPASQQYSSGMPLTDVCLEGLMVLNSEGKPQPWLATDWSFDDTNTVLTINLRDGVMFHDGTPFNAEAAKWNLDQVILAKKAELKSVTSVDVVDNDTIQLNLSEPDGLLTVYLGAMRGIMQSPTAFENSASTQEQRVAWAESNPVGTGPFKFVNWKHEVSITFEKNEDYWQEGQPYLDKIEFTIIVNEATLLAAFKAGDFDLMLTQQPQNAKDLENIGGYKFQLSDVDTIGGLAGDSAHPDSPWSNILVRQAAAYAIDNETFADTIGFGYWKATNQFDVPDRWGYNPNVVGYPYNPEKAKQLLVEAGYPDGFDTTIYGMSHYTTMLASIQGYLAEVGINAKSEIVTPAERVQMFAVKGWEGVWIWECTVSPTTLVNMGRNFTTAAAPTRSISVDWPADFTSLVDEAITATDFDTQQEMTWEIQKKLVDEYALITFIFARYTPIPMQMYLHDAFDDVSLHWTPAKTWLDK